MASTTRTFIAIAVPDVPGQKLLRLQTLLAPDLTGVQWATIPPFHITLAFLGDVAATDLNDLCRATASATAPMAPFDLRLEGLGVFPDPARPRVLWVGAIGPGVPALEALRKGVADAIRGSGQFTFDERFHPHVTLGRLKPGRAPSPDVDPALKHYRTWSPGSFTVSEVVVFASTSSSDGPIYTPLGRASLRGGKPGRKP